MSTLLSIADTIEVGEASKYLSANYTDTEKLFGGSVIEPVPPIQIAFVTDALKWGNDGGAQTTSSLRQVANYLYWLCGLFQLQAQLAINGPGGGSVSPTTPTQVLPNPLDFAVRSTSFIPSGGGSASIPQFIGYNVEFSRNGIVQNTTFVVGYSFFLWDRVTGIFQCFPEASAGELFRITPVG